MDENNQKPEKKISRATLTFYIVALFSVAIALILISYVAQARADRQLESLHSELNEQQTVAQGATQKMEDLQRQFDQVSTELGQIQAALGDADGEQTPAERIQALQSREKLLSKLVEAGEAARGGAKERLDSLLAEIQSGWTEQQLARRADGGLLTDTEYEAWQGLLRDADDTDTTDENEE